MAPFLFKRFNIAYYYFFGFKQGILNITSNNTKFMDEVMGLKKNEQIVNMKEGGTYEIQAVETRDANRFVRRIQEANK